MMKATTLLAQLLSGSAYFDFAKASSGLGTANLAVSRTELAFAKSKDTLSGSTSAGKLVRFIILDDQQLTELASIESLVNATDITESKWGLAPHAKLTHYNGKAWGLGFQFIV